MQSFLRTSDCTVCSEPAYPAGLCDCGAALSAAFKVERIFERSLPYRPDGSPDVVQQSSNFAFGSSFHAACLVYAAQGEVSTLHDWPRWRSVVNIARRS